MLSFSLKRAILIVRSGGLNTMNILGQDMHREIACIPYRRITNNNNNLINPSDLCYQLDIDLDAEFKNQPYINQYPNFITDSKSSVFSHIDMALEHGISHFNLHIVCSKTSCVETKISRSCKFLQGIKNTYRAQKNINFLIDLVGIAFHSDCSWGVKKDNKISAEATLNLLAEIGKSFSLAGADKILTIGRINYEVAAVQVGIKNNNKNNTTVASFSTNSSVVMAYFDPNNINPDRSQVEQLLSPFNINEMIIRALLDIAEGSTEIYQKPLAHMHVIERLRTLLASKSLFSEFINTQLSEIREYHFYEKRLKSLEKLDDFNHIKIGGYVVSGDYFKTLDLAKNHGEYFAYKYLNEQYCLFKQVAGSHFSTIIDRNALWYLQQQKIFKNN